MANDKIKAFDDYYDTDPSYRETFNNYYGEDITNDAIGLVDRFCNWYSKDTTTGFIKNHINSYLRNKKWTQVLAAIVCSIICIIPVAALGVIIALVLGTLAIIVFGIGIALLAILPIFLPCYCIYSYFSDLAKKIKRFKDIGNASLGIVSDFTIRLPSGVYVFDVEEYRKNINK